MKTPKDVKRDDYLKKIQDFFEQAGEEVIRTGSNEFAIPVVDSCNEEFFLRFVISAPRGARDEGEYDAYGVAQAYQMKCEQTAARKAQRAIDKKKKMERDLAARKAKAESSKG